MIQDHIKEYYLKMIFNTKWDTRDIKNYIDEFHKLYLSKPIIDNTGGMKSAHLFNAWYIIKKMQPKHIIESGVWKGLGTWFFKEASPESQIISIDPYPNFREITLDSVKYITNDFLSIDWKNIIDTKNTLVFFDDHQDALERLKYCKEHNFKYIMYEDNYPYDRGDVYSIKKVISQKPFVIDHAGTQRWFDNKPEDYQYLINNIKYYQELPPIFKDKITRWNSLWDSDGYETPEPLFDIIDKDKYSIFFIERFDYTWICYLEI